MFEFIKTIYLSFNAPLWAVLGAPIGMVLALHFASDKNAPIQGARVDSVAREARLVHSATRSWLKSTGFFIAFGYALFCSVFIVDRRIILDFIDKLPI
jgi:hypothetical protein